MAAHVDSYSTGWHHGAHTHADNAAENTQPRWLRTLSANVQMRHYRENETFQPLMASFAAQAAEHDTVADLTAQCDDLSAALRTISESAAHALHDIPTQQAVVHDLDSLAISLPEGTPRRGLAGGAKTSESVAESLRTSLRSRLHADAIHSGVYAGPGGRATETATRTVDALGNAASVVSRAHGALVREVQRLNEDLASASKDTQLVASLNAKIDFLTRRVDELAETVREKESNIVSLSDELRVHQLELTTTVERWRTADRERQRLDSDNKDLLNRWMQLKSSQVSQVNKANEIVEDALRTKKAAEDAAAAVAAAAINITSTSLPGITGSQYISQGFDPNASVLYGSTPENNNNNNTPGTQSFHQYQKQPISRQISTPSMLNQQYQQQQQQQQQPQHQLHHQSSLPSIGRGHGRDGSARGLQDQQQQSSRPAVNPLIPSRHLARFTIEKQQLGNNNGQTSFNCGTICGQLIALASKNSNEISFFMPPIPTQGKIPNSTITPLYSLGTDFTQFDSLDSSVDRNSNVAPGMEISSHLLGVPSNSNNLLIMGPIFHNGYISDSNLSSINLDSGHLGKVTSAKLGKSYLTNGFNGNYIVSGSDDRSIILRDWTIASSGQLNNDDRYIALLKSVSRVTDVDICGAGQFNGCIISTHSDGHIRLWDYRTRARPIFEVPMSILVNPHAGSMTDSTISNIQEGMNAGGLTQSMHQRSVAAISVAVSADGSNVATVCVDDTQGQLQHQQPSEQQLFAHVFDLAHAINNNSIPTATAGGAGRYSLKSRELKSFNLGKPAKATFNPESQSILTVGSDTGKVLLWSLPSTKIGATYSSHKRPIILSDWITPFPGGKPVLATVDSNEISIWG